MYCGAHGRCRRNSNAARLHPLLPRLLLYFRVRPLRLLPGRAMLWLRKVALPLRRPGNNNHSPRRAATPVFHALPSLRESKGSSSPTYLAPHRKRNPRRSHSLLSLACLSQFRPRRRSRSPAAPFTHPHRNPSLNRCPRRTPSISITCLRPSPPGSRAVRSRLAGWLSSTRCRGLRVRNHYWWTRRTVGGIAVGA